VGREMSSPTPPKTLVPVTGYVCLPQHAAPLFFPVPGKFGFFDLAIATDKAKD